MYTIANGRDSMLGERGGNTALFAARIKALRISMNLTQGEVGDVIGVNKSTVMRWERGEGTGNMKSPVVTALAKLFDVSETYLLGYTDDKKPSETRSLVDDMVEAFHKNPRLRILFSRSAKLKADDLDIVLKMVERMDQEDMNGN
jgi:transcriptional regulator with XRE-family HTH domain